MRTSTAHRQGNHEHDCLNDDQQTWEEAVDCGNVDVWLINPLILGP